MHLIQHLPHHLRKQYISCLTYGRIPTKGRNYVGTRNLRIIPAYPGSLYLNYLYRGSDFVSMPLRPIFKKKKKPFETSRQGRHSKTIILKHTQLSVVGMKMNSTKSVLALLLCCKAQSILGHCQLAEDVRTLSHELQ